jgi:hypothetical protein
MKLKIIQRLIGNRPTDEAVFAEKRFLQLSGKRDAAELLKEQQTAEYTTQKKKKK